MIMPALLLLAAVIPPIETVAEPSFSADGRYVAFASDERLTDDSVGSVREVYVRDLLTSSTILISANSAGGASGASFSPSISADGHLVAFVFLGHNLVGNDTNERADVFVRDWMAKKTILVSVSPSSGQSALGDSDQPVISGDGRTVIFRSAAADLVSGDHNEATDIFARDLAMNTTELVSVNRRGTSSGNAASSNPRFDPAGRIVFESYATDLTDDNLPPNVSRLFVRDLETHRTSLLSVPTPPPRRRSAPH
jgi:Tol biopolymer transport system component